MYINNSVIVFTQPVYKAYIQTFVYIAPPVHI